MIDPCIRVLACVILLLIPINRPLYSQAPAREGVSLVVDTRADETGPAFHACTDLPSDCSLRGAISKSNSDPLTHYSIYLPPGDYPLTIAGYEDLNAAGDLDLYGNLTLSGGGAQASIIDGNRNDRVFQVHPGAKVKLEDLAITGGKSPPGRLDSVEANGGGLDNQGELSLVRCFIHDNHAGDGENGHGLQDLPGEPGGHGGGIYNVSILALVDSQVVDNRAGAGGNGYQCDWSAPWDGCDGATGAAGGSGGGIYNRGVAIIRETIIRGNGSGAGGLGADFHHLYAGGQNSGPGGSGGGLVNLAKLVLIDSQVVGNHAGDGGEGGEALGRRYAISGDGGAGGPGGGLDNRGDLILDHSQVFENVAGKGGDAGMASPDNDSGRNGDGGSGGGVYNQGSLYSLETRFSGNETGMGGRGRSHCPLRCVSPGLDGSGGGIDNADLAQLTRGQVSGNLAYGPGGGIANQGRLQVSAVSVENNAAQQEGGGLFNRKSLALSNSAIVMNRTLPGADGADGLLSVEYSSLEELRIPAGRGAESASGGGLANQGTMTVDNTLVAGNTTGLGGRGGGGIDYPGLENGGQGGTGGRGGGIYNTGNATLTQVVVQDNRAGDGGPGGTAASGGLEGPPGFGGPGGGISNQDGYLQLFLVTLHKNAAGEGLPGGDGGGIYTTARLTYSGGSLQENTAGAGGSGGGLQALQTEILLQNVVVSGNLAGPGGTGGGLNFVAAPAQLLHTTLAGNAGGDGSGIHVISSTLALTNTILVGHTVGISLTNPATATLVNTLWGSGAWANLQDWAGDGTVQAGGWNAWDDPGFSRPGEGDFGLVSSSPAIDRAVKTAVAIDMENQQRPYPSGGLPDLGADEWQEAIPLSGVVISGPAGGIVSFPITCTAMISPVNATGNFLYFWSPEPQAGQRSLSARYVFAFPGLQAITVTALNASSVVTDTLVVSIQEGYSNFLPILFGSP